MKTEAILSAIENADYAEINAIVDAAQTRLLALNRQLKAGDVVKCCTYANGDVRLGKIVKASKTTAKISYNCNSTIYADAAYARAVQKRNAGQPVVDFFETRDLLDLRKL